MRHDKADFVVVVFLLFCGWDWYSILPAQITAEYGSCTVLPTHTPKTHEELKDMQGLIFMVRLLTIGQSVKSEWLSVAHLFR